MRVLPTLTAGGGSQSELTATSAHPGVSAHPNQESAKTDPYSPEFYQEERGAFRVTTELLARLVDVCNQNRTRCILLTLGGTSDEIKAGTFSAREMLPHEQLAAAGSTARILRSLDYAYDSRPV